jgi:hypothetical protein
VNVVGYAKSALYIAQCHRLYKGESHSFAQKYLEQLSASNLREVNAAQELLKQVAAVIQVKTRGTARATATKIDVENVSMESSSFVSSKFAARNCMVRAHVGQKCHPAWESVATFLFSVSPWAHPSSSRTSSTQLLTPWIVTTLIRSFSVLWWRLIGCIAVRATFSRRSSGEAGDIIAASPNGCRLWALGGTIYCRTPYISSSLTFNPLRVGTSGCASSPG